MNYRLALISITDLFVSTDPYTFFATITYPLRNNTIWDLKATDHVINNMNNLLPGTFRPYKPEPFFIRDRMLYIQRYNERHLFIDHGYDPKALFHLYKVTDIPNFITNVVSYKRLKAADYRLNDERNVII